MEIAVLSDIHGNFEAFKTCMKYCEERIIKEYIFLGDYLGEFAYPQRTMEYIYELKNKYKCTFIRGNKEDYWIHKDKVAGDKWKECDSTTGCLYYVYNELTGKDFEFFKALEISEQIKYEGMESITICHGTPFDNRGKMAPEDEATKEVLEKCEDNIIFCGHTHIQREMDYGDKKVYNPGAVGVPFQSGGKTQFAILKSDEKNIGKWQVEFVSLKYDVEKVVSEQIESGLAEKAPYWWKCVNHILHGSVYSMGNIFRQIMKRLEEKNIDFKWPDIPEEYWKEAYEEIFGIDDVISRDVFDDKREKDYPVCLESKLIHDSRWMSLYCDRVQMPMGNIIDTYYKVHIPNESVAVVIVNDEDKILIIESKRYTTGRLEWEIPAGAIEKGESIDQAARRECMEETGFKIKSVQYMCCNHPCNGLNDVMLHYCFARVSGEASEYDYNEVGTKKWLSKDDILKMLKNNETNSGISAYGLLHAINFFM